MKSGNIILNGVIFAGKFTVSKSTFKALGFDFIGLVDDWR